MMRQLLLCLSLAAVLAGCAGNPASRDDNVEQSVARQTTTSETRQRAKVHAELGALYLQDGRHEVALEEARIAIEADSDYAPAHSLMGLIYMSLRKNELAEKSLRRALQLAPGDPEINNNYGWYLCQHDRIRESYAYFQTALGNPLYQTPAKALTNMGVCALMDKDDRKGEEYLLRALRADRNNLRAMYLLAELNYRGGRHADARQWMKDLHAKLEPTAESAWLALRIERKLGDREGEARFTGVLRRKYRDSLEYQRLSRGEFD
jgi:type IV pilus assembly protein PilF